VASHNPVPDGVLLYYTPVPIVILGAIVVAVMISLPEGIMGIPEAFKRLIRRTSKKGA